MNRMGLAPTGRLHLLLLLLALVLAPHGLADTTTEDNPINTCTCLWQGSFTEIADTADLIVLGAVTQHRGNAADFAIEEIKKNTRRFAKRQLTWYRKDESIMWFDYLEDVNQIISYIENKKTSI